VVGCVGYDDDDDDDWYGERILSHVPTTSTHGFNISGSAIVDAATWVVVLVVADKFEERDEEAPLPMGTKINVGYYTVDDRGSLG
jgi:hypothetical protein